MACVKLFAFILTLLSFGVIGCNAQRWKRNDLIIEPMLPHNNSSLTDGANPTDKVFLQNLTEFTVYRGQWTNARRTVPRAQLHCPDTNGTENCLKVKIMEVRFYNKGWNGTSVQWECKAKMDSY